MALSMPYNNYITFGNELIFVEFLLYLLDK
jgi:hypothetical protein